MGRSRTGGRAILIGPDVDTKQVGTWDLLPPFGGKEGGHGK
jgi:hypothetical protein